MKKGQDVRRRREAVLEVVVNCYVDSAEPVGSRMVSRKVGLSSATIRNVMQDLEEEGFIAQPHTSAGRVPTEKGYRYYVDSLMHLRALTETQTRTIDSEYRSKMKSLDDIFAKTSHILSRITMCAGVVILPKTEESYFKHVDLVPIARNKILVLLITESGLAKEFIISLEQPVDKETLEGIANFLNGAFYDMTLDEIKDHLKSEIRAERESSRRIVERARGIMDAILMAHVDSRLYIDGASHMLSQPEFADARRIRAMMEFLEDRDGLTGLFSQKAKETGTRILIGRESRIKGLSGISVVTRGYRIKGNAIGRLGVIGPTRMSYDRIVPIVNFLADTLTGMLNELEG